MHGVWLRVRDLIYLDLGMGLSQGAVNTAAASSRSGWGQVGDCVALG